MRPRTKPNGVTEQVKKLKSENQNIENEIALLYDQEKMRYEQIASIYKVRIDTIRYIHNRYIERLIDEHKISLRKKNNTNANTI